MKNFLVAFALVTTLFISGCGGGSISPNVVDDLEHSEVGEAVTDAVDAADSVMTESGDAVRNAWEDVRDSLDSLFDRF